MSNATDMDCVMGYGTDMFIETTFMRYGHGPGSLIGITQNEKAVHIWAMSLHIGSRLIKDMADLKDSSPVDIIKKEFVPRIKYDENYRQIIREKLKTRIDPLNTPTASSTSCSKCYKKNIDMICNELVSTVELSNLPNSLVILGKHQYLQRYVMDCKS